jgi:hypothetical protein
MIKTLVLAFVMLITATCGAQEPVTIFEGPTSVPSGGFAVYFTLPANSVPIWKNEFPKDAQPPIASMDIVTKRTYFGFFSTVPGTYKFDVIAQVPKPGLDELVYGTHTVVVGQGPTPIVPGPTPGPIVPVLTPSVELQTILTPLKTLTTANQEKAAKLAGIFRDFHNVLKAGTLPNTNAAFRDSLVAFLNSAATDAGLAGAFPGHSAALNVALKAYIGNDDGIVDQQRVLDFVSGLVWASTP